MNGRCETCSAEKVCAYPYKPTECANRRKFEMHPEAVDCPACNGTGYTYPWRCKQCSGNGIVPGHNVLGNRLAAGGAAKEGENE